MSRLIGTKEFEAGADAPRIEFPCDYPIKVLGRSDACFVEMVTAVVLQHDPGFDPATASRRDSRRGAFCSITLTIRATGVEQLQALHTALQRIEAVKMVL